MRTYHLDSDGRLDFERKSLQGAGATYMRRVKPAVYTTRFINEGRIYTSKVPSVPFPEESVFTHLFETLYHRHSPWKAAFIDGPTGRILTRQQLKDLSLSLAHGLTVELPKLGGISLKKGDIIMIFSPNSLSYPIAMFGAVAAGMTIAFTNPTYTARELRHQWKDSRATLVFAHPSLLPLVREAAENLGLDIRKSVVSLDWDVVDSASTKLIRMQDLLGRGKLTKEVPFYGQSSNDTAYVFYSSGTTGLPKGVESTHKNFVCELAMLEASLPLPVSHEATSIAFPPFAHIIGAMWIIHYHFAQGLPVVVFSKYDPETLCRAVDKYRATVLSAVPPILLSLLHHPAVSKYDLSSLKLVTSGGAPLQSGLANPVIAKLSSLKSFPSLVQLYGLTESTLAVSAVPISNSKDKVDSCGVLLPNIEARIVNEHHQDVEHGTPGELWIRGPAIMKGYLNNVEATKKTFTDEWFMTGDVARFDDEGFLYIVDRKKELIKYKGFQVAPAELENLLLEHPDIVDVAVVGVDSGVGDGTEYPRAFVVHRKGKSHAQSTLKADVQRWLEPKVANHKYLRGGIIVVDAIPKSASGKILRRELRTSKINVDTPVASRTRL